MKEDKCTILYCVFVRTFVVLFFTVPEPKLRAKKLQFLRFRFRFHNTGARCSLFVIVSLLSLPPEILCFPGFHQLIHPQILMLIICDCFSGLQCCGSEFGSGSTYFWASWIRIRIHQSEVWIRILLSPSKKSKKNLDSFCFVTSF
jgi:hypothetical protein